MLIQEIIRKKRDGFSLNPNEIEYYIDGILKRTINESHIAAFCMAVFYQGMSIEEIYSLTNQMVQSGERLLWDDIDGPVIDKHSTGGVGDKVSLMVAPIVASCGLFIPMISGRGLGHTGGTLDKLESIPGYNTIPDNNLFRKVVRRTGCAIIGQTTSLAPADKIIYGVRDVTATVESVPLITASILSKKLAAGLDGLVMDIKVGNGAFANNLKFANEIGLTIVNVSKKFGMKTSATITDMNQPLGTSVGNSLEVIESINYLKNINKDHRLDELILSLSTEMLMISGLFESKKNALKKVNEVLKNGLAAETFEKMVYELGGPKDILNARKNHFSEATIVKPAIANISGFISSINTRDIGLGVVELGGGRKHSKDVIDHSVGLTDLLGLNQKIEKGQPLAMVYAKCDDDANRMIKIILNAYTISDSLEQNTPVIIGNI